MADKVQTGISITRDAHHIVKEYADERGLNFSAALENVIREWALIDRPAGYRATAAGIAAAQAAGNAAYDAALPDGSEAAYDAYRKAFDEAMAEAK
jgi:hypothetical protein